MDKVVFFLPLVFGHLLLETGGVLSSPTTSDTNVKGQDRYTPGYLLSLGQSLNSPLLKLIGQTLCNTTPQCSDWSQWSKCSEISIGQFGIRNRTRVCGHNERGCRADSMQTAEEEIERNLCEGLCPPDYNPTKHGFCLKYVATSMNHSTAVKRCQEDEAYVVNVNSKSKLDDIGTFKTGSAFWVDGTRTSAASPWLYTYDKSPASMNWASGEPDNRAIALCMIYSSSSFDRHDVPCASGYHVVCENVGQV